MTNFDDIYNSIMCEMTSGSVVPSTATPQSVIQGDSSDDDDTYAKGDATNPHGSEDLLGRGGMIQKKKKCNKKKCKKKCKKSKPIV